MLKLKSIINKIYMLDTHNRYTALEGLRGFAILKNF